MAKKTGTRSQNVFLQKKCQNAHINGKKTARVRIRDGTFLKVAKIWVHIHKRYFFDGVPILTTTNETIRNGPIA